MSKIYLFYLLNLEGGDNRLYASTEDKELAAMFREERNMALFKELTIKLDKRDLLEFKNYNSDTTLTRTGFLSKSTDNPCKRSYIKVVATWGEEKTVLTSQDRIYPEMFGRILFDPSIFTKDVQKALYHLGYFDMYQWLYTSGYLVERWDSEMYDGIVDMSYNDNDDSIEPIRKTPITDDFSIFMLLYGRLMSTKGKLDRSDYKENEKGAE